MDYAQIIQDTLELLGDLSPGSSTYMPGGDTTQMALAIQWAQEQMAIELDLTYFEAIVPVTAMPPINGMPAVTGAFGGFPVPSDAIDLRRVMVSSVPPMVTFSASAAPANWDIDIGDSSGNYALVYTYADANGVSTYAAYAANAVSLAGPELTDYPLVSPFTNLALPAFLYTSYPSPANLASTTNMNEMVFRLHATDTLHATCTLAARVAWMPRLYYANNAGDPVGIQAQSSIMASASPSLIHINVGTPADTLFFAFPTEVGTPTVTILNVNTQLWESVPITVYASGTMITNPFGIGQSFTVFQVTTGGLSGGNLAAYTDPINNFVALSLSYSLHGLLLDF